MKEGLKERTAKGLMWGAINNMTSQLLMALIAVGHPADEPEAPKRKTVEDLLTIK